MLGVGTGDLYMVGTGDWGVRGGDWGLIHGDVLQ